MSEAPETTKSPMTEADWAEAKALYELGKATKADLAKKFGVHRNTIANGMTSRGAIYGSRSKQIEEATVQAAKSDASKLVDEIAGMKQDRKNAINLLAKVQNKVMAECLRDNRPVSSAADEFRTINTILKNTAIIREELWAIYDLDRDPDAADEIPEFIVSEYTPEEIDLINKQRLGIEPEVELARVVEGAEVDPLEEILGDAG